MVSFEIFSCFTRSTVYWILNWQVVHIIIYLYNSFLDTIPLIVVIHKRGKIEMNDCGTLLTLPFALTTGKPQKVSFFSISTMRPILSTLFKHNAGEFISSLKEENSIFNTDSKQDLLTIIWTEYNHSKNTFLHT